MIVEAAGLRKSYGGQQVLDGVDLEVPEGTVLALLGPNGAGKTTVVRVLSTLTRPDGGSATVAGHDVVRDPVGVRGVISLTGQYAALDDRQTGLENLVMLGRLAHLGRATARRRAAELLERFDLVDDADRRVGQWSGGMRRRLDLAMSLISGPRVVFLDEPTTGLDPASRATTWDAVAELVAAGTTLVLTTQYLEEADRLADQVVLIDAGRVTAAGTPDALKAQVGGERLEVRLLDPADRGAALTALRAGALSGTDGHVVDLPSDGSADHLRLVLDALHEAGVPVERVSAHRPTLDDVFLALTAGAPHPAPVPA